MSNALFDQAQAQALIADLFAELKSADPGCALDYESLSEAQSQCLGKSLAGSLFFRDQIIRHPDWLGAILDNPSALPDLKHYAQTLQERIDNIDMALSAAAKVDTLDHILRQHRNQAMVGIIWAELNQLTPVETITEHLSALASASIQVAMDFHYRQLVADVGVPVGQDSGEIQPMLVLGMGKLGAWELNLSSDIDLIFAYPEQGQTRAPEGKKVRKTLSNQEFFIRLGQALIKSLDKQTVDGFVFRVDMRLRPYGQSGALAMNFGFLEDYYQNQGREWERYAMIKARVVATSEPEVNSKFARAVSRELMALLRPFSYRRYVDFSVINALRDMKGLINREVKLRGKSQDVKLGYGGIREVEFIVQAFQLVRGGREQVLQERRLQKVLPLLATLGHLPKAVAEKLALAYPFLRRVEHAIQAWADRQTQALPMDAEQQARMAYVLGFTSWDAFIAHLNQVRDGVNQEFQAVVGEQERGQATVEPLPSSLWLGISRDQLSVDDQLSLVNQLKLSPAEPVLEALQGFAGARVLQGLPAQSQTRMDQMMAVLLAAVARFDYTEGAEWAALPTSMDDAQLLARTLPLMETIARRSAYLVLLLENPTVLPHLLRLFSASSWIAQEITKHPALLEELLDGASLHQVPEPETLASELAQVMLGIAADDLESQMDALRYFRRAHGLHVAACEVSGSLPLMKVSDYLTWVAEEILKQVLEIAWADMVEKYGWPKDEQGVRRDKGFIVVAYGKAGGLEMAHGSDLDLVFMHNCEHTGVTDGAKVIDVQTFYTRLGQKIIHMLNTRTPSGRLYEVDMRLRPSGNSGLLVTSLTAFAKYQQKDAWTWEHQALLRARVVAGSNSLAEDFNQLRASVLCQPRDRQQLRHEVVEMRHKMRSHLASNAADGKFNLKQDAGGIVDIEFMVQYAALAWANEYPELVRYSDNIRILESLGQAGLLDSTEVDQLIEAYKIYRATGHRLALQELPAELPAEALMEHRERVGALWRQRMEPAAQN